MASSQINCPNCGQSYFVQPEQWAQYAGQTINCTRCGKEFQVTPQAATQPPPMPVQYASPMQTNAVGPTSPFQPNAPIPYYPGAPIPTSGWAVASLVTGLLAFCVPILAGGFAIVSGAIGMSQTANGRMKGRGMAVAGLILGVLSMLFYALVFIGSVTSR